MINWEYTTKHWTVNLNELGGEGWELCAIDRTYWYILKRPMKCINCDHHKIKNGIAKCEYDEGNTFKGNGCKHFKKRQ